MASVETRLSGERPGPAARFAAATVGDYRTRMMLAYAMSLFLVTLCFHLPVEERMGATGWQLQGGTKRMQVDVAEVQHRDERAGGYTGVPAVELGPGKTEEAGREDGLEEERELAGRQEAEPESTPSAERMEARTAILEYSEEQPTIAGGVGAYYIHIVYPPEAVEAGIQGRLVLSFVVEPDGVASHIEVEESLHPLCDSSAVAALRATRFIPGYQNGEAVRVRMRLPVRFRLVGDRAPDEAPEQPPGG